jgi:hypothetical protein
VTGNKATSIFTGETASCRNLSSVDSDVYHAVVPGWLDKWAHAGQQIASFEIFCDSAAVLCLYQLVVSWLLIGHTCLTQIFVMWRGHLFSMFLTYYATF